MPYARRTREAPGSPAVLVREAFERSGRHDPALLKRCVAEAKATTQKGDDPALTARWAIQGEGLRVAPGDGPIEILPSGRDPSLILVLDALDAEERALKARIDALAERRRAAVSEALLRRLAEEGRSHSDDLVCLGNHACDGSPSGLCCYDADEDPALDDCLFCGQPDERK